MIDIHCHLLPGIDDGPQDWPEAVALAGLFERAGIRKAVITPHFIPGVYLWSHGEGEMLHRRFRERLQREGIAVETFLAAEVGIFPELPAWLGDGRVPLMPTGHHLLLEAPMYGSEALVRDMAFAVLSMGITPVFAHPERSLFFTNLELARDIVASEGELQLDAGSLIGRWGEHLKRLALDLIEDGLVRYVASDSHGPERRGPEEFVAAAETVEEFWGLEARQKLFHDHPLALTVPPP